MNVSVRLEEPADEAGVRETNEEAFGTPLEARLVDALRGSPGSISLVATTDSRVVGHILFTPVTIEPTANVRIAGLAPMSVRRMYQRRGVGGQLIRAGLDACRRQGFAAVVLVGHSASSSVTAKTITNTVQAPIDGGPECASGGNFLGRPTATDIGLAKPTGAESRGICSAEAEGKRGFAISS